ncbi:CAP domain-containing protein [Clostridium sardiniense]|uniref:CAP domain-containing protein n=1 Tax=Clostridium sardiniense TaxID=29369 RepID=UPI003D339DB9
MKNKLIAILVTATLLGGAGASVFAASGQDAKNEVAQVEATKGNTDKNVQVNSDSKVKATELSSSQNVKVVKENSNKGAYNDKQVSNDTQNCKSQDSKNVEKKKVSNDTNNTTKKKENSNSACNKNLNTGNKNTNANADNKNTSGNKDGQASTANEKFMAQVEQKIFEKVNAERSKAGVPTLSYNKTMEKYARMKSQDMGDRGYFDHKDPQGNLITAKMKNDGVSYKAWGENIAYIGGESDANALADQFMTNWMNSPGHRQNILSKDFTGIGVGVYKSGDKVYATQEFYK